MRRNRRLFSAVAGMRLAVAGALVAIILSLPVWAAERVGTRAAVHPGFGRIVFDWPMPPGFDAGIENRLLHVTFAKPLNASFAEVRRTLSGYLRDVRLEPDGRTVTFTLSGDFGLRSFVYEKSVVIDLIGEAPAQRDAAVAAAPRVPVRVGDHRGYSRIVFDWRRPVNYKVTREDGRAVIRFDRAATIDLTAFDASPPKHVRSGGAEIVGKRTVVTLALAPATRLRHFRSGMKVVVDVLAAPAGPVVTREVAPPPPAASPPPPAASPPPETKPGPVAEARSEPAPPGVAASEPATEAPVDDARPAAGGDEAATPSAPGDGANATTAAEGAPPEPIDLVPSANQGETPAARSGGATEVRLSLGPPQLGVTIENTANRTTVTFNGGGRRLASAAFVRGDHFWVVFPRDYGIDLTPLNAVKSPAYERVDRVAHSKATVLRFRLRPGYGASFHRRDADWIARFTREPGPPTEIEVRNFDDERRGRGAQVLIADVARRVQLNDPGDGAALVVVPVMASGVGVTPARSYPEFDLLATVQGVVVRPGVRGVNVRTGLAGIEVAYRPARDDQAAAQQAARIARRTRSAVNLFDLVGWRNKGGADFFKSQQELRVAVATAPVVRRTRARMAYAQFLFANGYFPETLGMVRMLIADDRTAARDPVMRGIRGAARVMLGRYAEAATDLSDPALDGYDDIALWRGVLASRQGDVQSAMVQFVRAGDLWLGLPLPARNHIGLRAAETAIELHSYSVANTYLDGILRSNPGDAMRDRVAYLRGRVLLGTGNEEEALRLWDEVNDSPDRYTWARVRFQRTLLRLDKGEIDASEAAKTLEPLRFAWRGDGFELALLQRLAELYFTARQYEKGLDIMKLAVTRFADHPVAAVLASRMNQLFADLFLDGGVADMPARKVLSLFYDFRELTPVGVDGDKVVQALVDRLVEVDLLDKAAELLDHQITYRLEGVEKARVGARLATIRLMDQKPKAAIEALAASVIDNLPGKLVAERRRLRVRALLDLDRGDEALRLLKGDDSRDAQLLRAEKFWHDKDWPRVAMVLESVLGTTPTEKPLSRFASRQILRLAVAYALMPDRKALRGLRRRFATAMAGDPNASTFEVITGETDTRGLGLRQLPAAIAQVSSFEAFMTDYRERFASPAPASVN
ncbi:MAG: hypothetical protein ACE5H8_07660 [Alphaproteobacteria bacterium]